MDTVDTSALRAAVLEDILSGQRDPPLVNWEDEGDEGDAAMPGRTSHWVLEEDEAGRVTTIKCERDDVDDDDGDFRSLLKVMREEEQEADEDEAREAAPLLERVREEQKYGGVF